MYITGANYICTARSLRPWLSFVCGRFTLTGVEQVTGVEPVKLS